MDWRKAQRAASLVKSGATVYKSRARGILPEGYEHGTRLRIEGLNQEWDADGLRNLARELWFLRPPEPLVDDLEERDSFDIELEGAAEDERVAFNNQLEKAFQSWIAEIKGAVTHGRGGSKASVTVTFKDGQTETQSFSLSHAALDDASFRIRVYKLSGKQAAGISVTDVRWRIGSTRAAEPLAK